MQVLPYPLTTLHVVWPWSDPPALETCRALLSAHGAVRELSRPPVAHDAKAPDLDRAPPWALEVAPVGAAPPIYLWPTAAEPFSLGVVAEMLDANARERKRFRRARWHLALHQLLDGADPAAAYHRLVQLAVLVCPELPALYDAESLVLRPGERVRRIAAQAHPPPVHALYRIHAVLPDADLDGDPMPDEHAWLHTHGLARAGLPELEVNQVPAALALSAGRLLNLLAACCLGDPRVLEGDATVEVVRGYPVRARPIEALGEDVKPPPGDPARGWSHGGRRAALVDPRAGRGPPLACLRALEAGAVVAGGSERETRRAAERARAAWPTFGMAFASHRRDPGYAFLVQLGCPVDGGRSGEREHLWFAVLEIAPGRVRGRLLNAPVAIRRMTKDDVRWHDLRLLSDWTIHRPDGPVHAGDAYAELQE